MVSCSSEFQRLIVHYKKKKKKSHQKNPPQNIAYELIVCEPPAALTPFRSTFDTSSDAPSRRGTERCELLVCKRRAAQRFQNWLYV